MAKRLSASLTLAAAVSLAVGLTAVASAQAHPVSQRARLHPTHAARARTHVTKYGSSSKMPTSKRHPSGGAVNLGEDGTLQRYVNRSNSARPAVVRRHGKTVLRASSGDSWLPTVSPTPVAAGQHPGQQKAWEGLNEYDNGVYAGFSLEPPDQGMCAGNGHVFELINDVVRVYTANGAPEGPPVYLNDFFQEPGYQFTTDPSCVYDAGSNRFFATQLTLDVDPNTGNLTGRDWLDVAVSKTGDPTAGYNFYRIYVTDDGSNGTPSHTDCPCVGDYPHLGTDAYGLYLTTNEYPFSGPGANGNNFNGAQLYALSKAALASGAAHVRVIHFQNLRVPTSSGPRYPGFTLWPAQSAGSAYDMTANGTMPFLSSFAAEEARPDNFTGHSNWVGVWQLRRTKTLQSSTPSLRLGVARLVAGDYGIPPMSNQKPGPTPLKDCLNVGCVNINDQYAPEEEGAFDSSDTRMLTAGYANGSVYGALDTAMLVNGNVKAGFEWFQVNVANPPLSVRSGYVGVGGQNVTYPAIATDPNGQGYLGVTLAGDNYYPSAAYMSWDSNGPGSSVYVSGLGKAPEDGFCEYLYFNCAQTPTPQIRPRWGDYGYAAWDGTQFFVANEWIAHSCDFATFDNDHTCGGTRTFYGNFSTHIARLASPTN
jgi:hypothetical protein